MAGGQLAQVLRSALVACGHAVPEDVARELDRLAARVTGDPDLVPTERDPGDDPTSLGSAGTWIDDGVAEPSTAEELILPPRYTLVGTLGSGGMGRVLKVRDTALGRVVALKIVRDLRTPAQQRRFLAEARATAQLEHPGIVPVYDVGTLRSGQPYYTMRVVTGRTLAAALRAVHSASSGGSWTPAADGTTLRRLLGVLAAVCDAVAYAHARAVVHRDLKPDNVMIGAYGEALVLDWGLAKVVGTTEESEPVTTGTEDTLGTIAGSVAGTPSYMAPEQARGDVALDARVDVHALGAVLYELLAGRPPFTGRTRHGTLASVVHDVPAPIETVTALPVPDGLGELVAACLAKEREHRPADASVLARTLHDWLDGARRREQALERVAAADSLAVEVGRLKDEARVLEERAAAELAPVVPWEPVERKIGAWRLQDRAAQLRLDAELAEERRIQVLHEALHQAEVPEARARLADFYRERHASAESAREAAVAARLEVLLRANDVGPHHAYLRGTGAVTLVTDPPGARVEAHRFEVRDRRLVPVPYQDLGSTPIRGVELPMGSYLLVIRAPGRLVVRYPVRVDREGHWDGVAPGETEPLPIVLPACDGWNPIDAYVPAGWFLAGGDGAADYPRPTQRIWVDGLVVRRFPVTNWEYLAFLDALVARADEAEAVRRAPRDETAEVSIVYVLGSDGRWRLEPDEHGDVWDPQYPVLQVSADDASAYAVWLAAESEQPWRLPLELEWEKAARGVDGRIFPWGDFLDPTWCCIRETHRGPAHPAPVHAFPEDESVYGVRGVAGNCMEWCADQFQPEGPPVLLARPVLVQEGDQRVVRSSTWHGGARWARCAGRTSAHRARRTPHFGFRVVRSYP